MERLTNVIQPYAWGSKELIARLCGRPVSESPEAELWMGAHPLAPSRVGNLTLLDLIEGTSEATLGPRVVKRYGRISPICSSSSPPRSRCLCRPTRA